MLGSSRSMFGYQQLRFLHSKYFIYFIYLKTNGPKYYYSVDGSFFQHNNPGNYYFSSDRCASTGWLSVFGTTWTGQRSATTFPPVWWWVLTTRCICVCPYLNICSQTSFSLHSHRSCRSSSRWDEASVLHYILYTDHQTPLKLALFSSVNKSTKPYDALPRLSLGEAVPYCCLKMDDWIKYMKCLYLMRNLVNWLW